MRSPLLSGVVGPEGGGDPRSRRFVLPDCQTQKVRFFIHEHSR